jgi:hypothetical protein
MYVELPPYSRTTVSPGAGLAHSRFGIQVQSVATTNPAVPLVVEGAYYWSVDGVFWAAGANHLATPIP